MNYYVSDFIIRIKNASLSKRRKVTLPYSKLNKAVGNVLVKKHFLQDLKEEKEGNKKVLVGSIAYDKSRPQLSGASIVSKPSLRIYIGYSEIARKERRGLGTLILSTSLGILSGEEARKKKVGGELLAEVW